MFSLSHTLKTLTGFSTSILKNIPDARLKELNEIFLYPNGDLIPLPSEYYKNACTHEELQLWCHIHAVYQLPVLELIDFIAENIEGKAIEIGAGNGSIGRALKIPVTDSKLQNRKDIENYYKLLKQPIVKYGSDVLNYEANRAVNKFKPDTVIGCWITEWNNYPTAQSSYWGVDEKNILRNKKYIFVGNKDVHGLKAILKKEHKEYQFPWLVSRANNQDNNIIYIWEKN